MPRRAVLAFLATALAGLTVLGVVTARDDRDLAFTLGVGPGLKAAELPPGGEACQRPVAVAEAFSGVRIQVGNYLRRGQPIAVTVRSLEGAGVLASGREPGGYPDFSLRTIALDRTVPRGARVAVCVRNGGRFGLAVYGAPAAAKAGSSVVVGGERVPTDLTLVFTREPRSALSQVPDVFDRAALFRPAWVGPWTYWLLAALALLAVPALLASALRGSFSEPGGDR